MVLDGRFVKLAKLKSDLILCVHYNVHSFLDHVVSQLSILVF